MKFSIVLFSKCVGQLCHQVWCTQKISKVLKKTFKNFKKNINKNNKPFCGQVKETSSAVLSSECLSDIKCLLIDYKLESENSLPQLASIQNGIDDLSRLETGFNMFVYKAIKLDKKSIILDQLTGYNCHFLLLMNLLFARQLLFQELSLEKFVNPSKTFCELLVLDSYLIIYLKTFLRFTRRLNATLENF